MQRHKGNNNDETIFSIRAIPTDNQIRSLLDPVEPSRVFPVYGKVFSLFENEGKIDSYRSFANGLLVSLDGVWFLFIGECVL